MCFIISQPSPWPLSRERTIIANSAALIAGIVVQAHHAEHFACGLLDDDGSHRMLGVVMDELVDKLGAHLAHGGEVAQPQIVGRYLAQAIRIEGGILRLERPKFDRGSVAQFEVAMYVQGAVLSSAYSPLNRRRPEPLHRSAAIGQQP